MRCILLSGGPPSDCAGVRLPRRPGDYVIACDAGYLLAARLGLRPDLAVGDFDSLRGGVDPSVPVHTAPRAKDDTDTMLGARLGLERGCREFLIVGGFGGRLDHTVANLQTLCFLAGEGASAQIRSDRNLAWAVRDGTLELEPLEGWHLSVFAASGPCEGVTLEGLAYPLDRRRLTPDYPIGVSNEFTGGPARVTVERGTLLVIASKEDP